MSYSREGGDYSTDLVDATDVFSFHIQQLTVLLCHDHRLSVDGGRVRGQGSGGQGANLVASNTTFSPNESPLCS